MKKTVKILALAMALLMLGMALASCGNSLSGTYTASVLLWDVDLKFTAGGKVTATMTGKITGEKVEAEGTYTIEDEQITFDFSDEDAKKIFGSVPMKFEKTDDGIKLGSIAEFKKK